ISKSQKGTVAERIYSALKQTIANLKGELEFPAADTADGVINFGRISERPQAKQKLKVWNRSCYVEKLLSVSDCSSKLKAEQVLKYRKILEELVSAGHFSELPDAGNTLILSSDLPKDAISLKLTKEPVLLAPVEREGAQSGQPSAEIGLLANVGSSCPPGAYLGFADFDSTAKVSAPVAYLLTVPSRLTVDQESVKVQVRKPGFIFDKETSSELSFRVGAKVSSSNSSEFEVLVQASAAVLDKGQSAKDKAVPQIAAGLINKGESLTVKVTSGVDSASPVKLSVEIPADTLAGKYEGSITVQCKERNDLVSSARVPFVIEVLPSPWDEMSPIAIPVILLLLVVLLLGAYMAVIGSGDRI
ncbi:MAG: hypothetical protein K2X27_07400, partial [Candidatus Obscuribacterales bacterium]|nr:hypothetical protein [Candidatus Obscuribacterales bacterium]